MTIPSVDFWSFIIELVMRNATMGITPLEDRLFVNLLIFDYFGSAFELRLISVLSVFEMRLRFVCDSGGAFAITAITIHKAF